MSGDATTGRTLAATARAYDGFLRDHIDRESNELFPLMTATLGADDAVMVAEFDRLEREEIGPGTHERLHGMIDELPGRIALYL